MKRQSQNHPGNTIPMSSCLAAVALLLGTGVGFRLLSQAIGASLGQIMTPSRPLADIPLKLGPWLGRDETLDERVLNLKSFDDDFVNRVYHNTKDGRQVWLFIGYSGRPYVHLEHRPELCYPSNGWQHIGEAEETLESPAGRAAPATLFEFRWVTGPLVARPLDGRQFVLATYFINGVYIGDSSDLRRFNARGRLLGRPGYVARLQFSLTATSDRAADAAVLREFASHFLDLIADSMPRP